MFRPRRLASMAALLVCGMFLLAFDRGSQSIGIFLFVLCVLLPIFLYRGLGRVVDGNSQLTDPKTVEFGQSRLVVVGPGLEKRNAVDEISRVLGRCRLLLSPPFQNRSCIGHSKEFVYPRTTAEVPRVCEIGNFLSSRCGMQSL